MRFRSSGPRSLIVVTTLTALALMGVAMLLTSHLLARSNEGDYELIQRVFATKMESLKDEAVETAEIVITTPAVRKAFLDRDRPKLLSECQPMFNVQKEKYGLDRSEFHEASGVNFLRLHQPDKFGDNEMDRRPMLAETHRNKAIRQGIEVGTLGPSVSAIVPIVDDAGKFSGSFEMALDFEPVLDELKTSFKFEGAVFIDEQLLRQVATGLPGEALSSRNRVGPYIRLHTTHDDLLESLVSAKEVDTPEPRSYERSEDGTTWGVQLIPLFDHAHKRIGTVALAHDFGDDVTAARRAMVWQALAALFGIVIMAGAVVIVIRGRLLAPLAALNEGISALVKGTEAPEADPIDTYCDELQTLANNYEELRSRRGL
jgi:methyl-accepting chemotaxis protein